MKLLLSLGHGYTAAALAARLLPLGWRVVGTTRTAAHAAEIAATGVEPLMWGSDLGPVLAEATHVLSSVAPDAAGDAVLRTYGGALAAARAKWVGYLSTTAVYGDHGGAWVDEDTPLTPTPARGDARVAAEAGWQALGGQAGGGQAGGLPLHIFRLAGIYGPGRGPFEKVRDGTARRVLKPGQVFSRIHVADIAQAVAVSMLRPMPGAVWNLCDDDPAPPEDVLSHAAALLGLPEPPGIAYADAEMTPLARSFYAENKRVRNDRIKRDLGLALIYPSYREGLAAILAGH